MTFTTSGQYIDIILRGTDSKQTHFWMTIELDSTDETLTT